MPLANLSPSIKLIIRNKDAETDSAFGPGVAALCRGVDETGSLNAAAKSMHMAYSKAWKTIKATEDALGFQLLVRDGAHGSTLSKEGKDLLEAYDELARHLKDEARSRFGILADE